MAFEQLYSARATKLTSSVIREILSIADNPNMISFAGGLPSSASFPVAEIKAAFNKVLTDSPQTVLQYSTTAGYAPLREWIAKRKSSKDLVISKEQVLIVSGSQQALDLLSKLFIDAGDKVITETPTYLGAIQAFSLFSPKYIAIDSDDDGIIVSNITAEQAKGAKFLYTMPNFQNPTGRKMSEQRRNDLVAKSREFDLLVVEDDPYGELWYTTEPAPSLLSRMPERVIHMGSFSKVLSPGLRLGYVIAPTAIINKLEQIKQATDLHTSTLSQYAVYEVIKDGFLDKHIPKIRDLYAKQAKAMLDALEKNMPSYVKWNKPEGGMFLWLELATDMDASAILCQAIAENVAFIPGEAFYATDARKNTLRLAFVTVPEASIHEGIKRLANIFKAIKA